jgi:hypothetical protein
MIMHKYQWMTDDIRISDVGDMKGKKLPHFSGSKNAGHQGARLD